MSLEGFLRKAVCVITRTIVGLVTFCLVLGGIAIAYLAVVFGIIWLLEVLPTIITVPILGIVLIIVALVLLWICHDFGGDILISHGIKFCKK